jgi:hypothetical protein
MFPLFKTKEISLNAGGKKFCVRIFKEEVSKNLDDLLSNLEFYWVFRDLNLSKRKYSILLY